MKGYLACMSKVSLSNTEAALSGFFSIHPNTKKHLVGKSNSCFYALIIHWPYHLQLTRLSLLPASRSVYAYKLYRMFRALKLTLAMILDY